MLGQPSGLEGSNRVAPLQRALDLVPPREQRLLRARIDVEPEPTLAASPAGSVGAPARSSTASAPAPQDAPHLD